MGEESAIHAQQPPLAEHVDIKDYTQRRHTGRDNIIQSPEAAAALVTILCVEGQVVRLCRDGL